MKLDHLALLSTPSDDMDATLHKFLTSFLGALPSREVLYLLAILVLAIHLLLLNWLHESEDDSKELKPQVMAASLISIAKPKAEIAPPKAVPPPPPEQKPQPKKTPAKPLERKPPPVVQKAPDFAPNTPVEETPPAPQPVAPVTDSKPVAAAPVVSEQVTEAKFSANYTEHPAKYPPIAKQRGWTGKVVLRVRLSAEGLCESVEIEQSSGHDILDESAVETVKTWKFIPAKRGSSAIASTVKVPINYNLNNN